MTTHSIRLYETNSHEKRNENKHKINIHFVDEDTSIVSEECNDDQELFSSFFISMVKTETSEIVQEMKIGKIIQKIPHYSWHYLPIEKSCRVSLYRGSKKIENDENNVSLTYRNIGNTTLKEYLQSLPDENIRQVKIMDCFNYVIYSIKKLLKFNVIHFNIKETNILYDIQNHRPILSHFQHSFLTDDVQNVFFSDDFYVYWCVEIYMMNQAFFHPWTKEKSTNEIQKYLKKFIHENFLIENKEQTYANYEKFFRQFYSSTSEQMIKQLFIPTVFSTWDTYSTMVSFSMIDDDFLKKWRTYVECSPNERPNVECF